MCLLRVPFRNHGCLKTLSIRTERQVKCRCRRQHLIPCPVDRFLYDWVFTCQAPLFFTLYCLTREVKCAPPSKLRFNLPFRAWVNAFILPITLYLFAVSFIFLTNAFLLGTYKHAFGHAGYTLLTAVGLAGFSSGRRHSSSAI